MHQLPVFISIVGTSTGGSHRQRYVLLTRGGKGFESTAGNYAQLQVRTAHQHIYFLYNIYLETIRFLICFMCKSNSEYATPFCFLSSVSCCAVRVKSLWPRSHLIRRADTSQGTTLTTQTPQSTLTRRWSWSTTCWRSLRCPRRLTNSTWRSATARHLSDPTT